MEDQARKLLFEIFKAALITKSEKDGMISKTCRHCGRAIYIGSITERGHKEYVLAGGHAEGCVVPRLFEYLKENE